MQVPDRQRHDADLASATKARDDVPYERSSPPIDWPIRSQTVSPFRVQDSYKTPVTNSAFFYLFGDETRRRVGINKEQVNL